MSRKQGIQILCDHCGETVVAFVRAEDGTYPAAEITSQEVWFDVPGSRGSVRWTDDDGQLQASQVEIFDSCDRCAAKALELIAQFYKRKP